MAVILFTSILVTMKKKNGGLSLPKLKFINSEFSNFPLLTYLGLWSKGLDSVVVALQIYKLAGFNIIGNPCHKVGFPTTIFLLVHFIWTTILIFPNTSVYQPFRLEKLILVQVKCAKIILGFQAPNKFTKKATGIYYDPNWKTTSII